MILDLLQVSPARTSILEKAGGFGVLPDSGGDNFLQLLKSGDSSMYEARDAITYNYDRQHMNRSEHEEYGGPDEEHSENDSGDDHRQIDLRAVEDLLKTRERLGQDSAAAAAAENDGLSTRDGKKIDLEGLARLAGKSRDSGETAARKEENSQSAGPQSIPGAEKIEKMRAHDAKTERAAQAAPGNADQVEKIDTPEKTDSKHAAKDGREETGRAASGKSASNPVRVVPPQSDQGETINLAALEGLQDRHEPSAEGSRAGDARADSRSNLRAAQQTQNSASSETEQSRPRRAMVQVVDLRTTEQPTRLEKLRTDIREAAVQGRSRGEPAAGSATVARATAPGGGSAGWGSNGQGGFGSGQNGSSGRSGINGDIMDRFFRGGSVSGSDSSGNSFASMLQRFGQNAPTSLTADAAQMLNSKFQEHLNADIVRQARFVLRDGEGGEIRLRLRPESLGNVQIQLDVKDNVIAARFLVENSSVRQIVEQQLGQLTQAFEDAGLELGSMDVSVGNQDFPEGSEESGESSQLRSTRSDEQQTEVLADSVRDVTMLGSGDQLINIMA